MSQETLKALVVHLKAHQFIKETIKKDMLKYGLSMSEFMVLELLYHKGSQTIQSVAKKVLLTSGSMTYVINQLEKKQMIQRKRDPQDGRITYVSLNEQAKSFMKSAFKEHEKMIEKMFSSLDEQQLQMWIASNKKIGKILEKELNK